METKCKHGRDQTHLNVDDMICCLETGKFGWEAESVSEEALLELTNNRGDDDDE